MLLLADSIHLFLTARLLEDGSKSSYRLLQRRLS